MPPARRHGLTLLELVIVLSLAGVMSAVALTRAGRFLDAIRVRGASADVLATFGAARHLALARSMQTVVELDTARRTMIVRIRNDTLRKRDLGLAHDVQLSANRTSMTYGATGVGYGAANLTVVVKRNSAIDSVLVSRLGRVRRSR